MGTIVVIIAFLLAASASPIDQSSHDSSVESSGTNVHDELHSSPDGVSSDVGNGSGEDGTVPHDVEHGSSSGDSTVSDGDYSQNQDEQSSSPSDTPSVSTNSDASNNSGQAVSSSVSTATPMSTEPPTDVVTDTTNVTQPPDADPYDCQNRNPQTHTYDACTFSCGGDMMAQAPDYSRCLLNYTGNFTENSEPAGLPENATGVCVDGMCKQMPNNVTETTTQSSTATTTTTASTTSETTREPSAADTDTNHEISGPGSPTSHNDSVVGIQISSQSPPPQLGDGPVIME